MPKKEKSSLNLNTKFSKTKLPVLLYYWEVPDRIPYKEPTYMKSIIALVSLLAGLYFWWAGQLLMTLLVVAFFYLYYLIISIKPVKVSHAIYSNGIKTLGEFYPWENLTYFWIGFRDGWYVVYVKTTLRMPKVLIMLADNQDQAKDIMLILGQYLNYRPFPKKQGFWEQNMYGKYLFISDIIDSTELIYNKQKLKKYLEKLIEKMNKKYSKKQKEVLKSVEK